MKKYPFKFLDAYTPEDTDIFFGREEEIEALYKMVFQSDILLVYGPSGAGKTSLLQCGLTSRFAPHDWLPLHVRRGNDLNDSLTQELQNAAGDYFKEDSQDWLTEIMEESDTESTVSNNPWQSTFSAIYLNSFRPVYLIFDQFEELYIIGSKDEQQQFIQNVQDILNVEQPVKLIFSIREEYLGYLYDFERAVPQLLRKKLRIEPMNYDKVKQVITGVNNYKDSNIHLKSGEEQAISEKIFQKVMGKEIRLTIPLPYLQVFLDKLYLSITQDEKRETEAVFTLQSIEQLGEIGDILRDFLDTQTEEISSSLRSQYPDATPENIWKLLSPFVTLEGTKDPHTIEQLYGRLPNLTKQMIDKTVGLFVDRRILRYYKENRFYEVAHDSLAQRIAEKRSDEEIALLEVSRLIRSQTVLKRAAREYFSEKQLNFISPFLGQLSLTEDEHTWIDESFAHVQAKKDAEEERQRAELRATRKRLRLVRSLLAMAVLGMIAAGYFYWDANLQKQYYIAAEQRALRQKDAADRARERADSLLEKTEHALEIVEQQKTELSEEKEARQRALNNARREEERRRAAEMENITKTISQIKNLMNVGDVKEAKQLLKNALETAPNNKQLLELKSQLQ